MAAWVALAAGPAEAQRGELRLRATAAGGIVASRDQWRALAFDLPVAEADVRVGWAPEGPLALEARLSGGAFFSESLSVGGLMDLTVGGEVSGDLGIGRAYVAAFVGAGVTGDLVRPVLRASLGLDLRAADDLDLGPVLMYGHLFQLDGPEQSDDAQWLALGLSIAVTPVSSPPAPDPPPASPPRPAARPRPRAALLPPMPPSDDAARGRQHRRPRARRRALITQHGAPQALHRSVKRILLPRPHPGPALLAPRPLPRALP